MDETRVCTRASKGEVAFRFMACTVLAMALYWTPDIRWNAAPDALGADRISAALSLPVETVSARCAAHGRVGLLVDAVLDGR